MKQAIRLAGVMAALVVCGASASSINSGGAYPGPAYRDTDLGGGELMVTVTGGGKVQAREIALRRAAEVCGSGGFDVVAGDVNTNERYVAHSSVVGASVEDQSTYDVTMIYQCRSGGGRFERQYAGPTDNSAASLPRY